MRFKSLLAAVAAVFSVSIAAPDTAQAHWQGADNSHSGSRAHHDPYAYFYEPRRYYTNATSRYWRPANKVRSHSKAHSRYKFRYHPAWGYKKSRAANHRWYR